MENVTLLRPDLSASESGSLASALPPDLLEAVRGRVRLLALFLVVAFGLDPTLYFGQRLVAALAGRSAALDPEFLGELPFRLADLGGCAASAALAWLAGSRRVSPSRLHTLGLFYEFVICMLVATAAYWRHQQLFGTPPNLTWVPSIVILFPLIMPGPPRRMLAAAIAAGSTTPLSLFLLDLAGRAKATPDGYASAVVGSTFAVACAYLGARVVYGLGRQVVTARELGSYRLEEKLGQGGMGEVWKARHRLLVRPAAIKIVRPSLAGGARRAWPSSCAAVSSGRRRSPPASGRRTPWSSTTSASPRTARSTTSWSCSTAWARTRS